MKRRCGKVIFKMRHNTSRHVYTYVVGIAGAWWRYEDGSEGRVMRKESIKVSRSYEDYIKEFPINAYDYHQV